MPFSYTTWTSSGKPSSRSYPRDSSFTFLSPASSASDFQLVLVIFYAVTLTIFPTSSLALHFVHTLVWCLFHNVGLGLLLRAQSQNKFLVRHFLKHYHYPQHDRGQGAVRETFQNWKQIYNMSMCMSYGEPSFVWKGWGSLTGCVDSVSGLLGLEVVLDSGLATLDRWKRAPPSYSRCCQFMLHLRFIFFRIDPPRYQLMIGLHIWSSLESYEVLGLFGGHLS